MKITFIEKIIIAMALPVAFLFTFFVYAEKPFPTFEICSGASCNPKLPTVTAPSKNPRIVSSKDIIPDDTVLGSGNEGPRYVRGKRVRIHAQVEDQSGLDSVIALIKDASGNNIVKIPLYDDGSPENADNDIFVDKFGSSGEDDYIYSSFWQITYYMKTGVSYFLHIEAVDHFGNKYVSPTTEGEIEFELVDDCSTICVNWCSLDSSKPCSLDSDCGADGPCVESTRCKDGSIELCKFSDISQCNSWVLDNTCSGLGECCGAAHTCCSGIGEVCGTSDTCIICDGECNGVVSNDFCSITQDEDKNPMGCCGNSCCEDGFDDLGNESCSDSAIDRYEDNGNCPQDCLDTTGPEIILDEPTVRKTVGVTGEFLFRVIVRDVLSDIKINPFIDIYDSSDTIVCSNITLGNMGDDLYGVYISPVDCAGLVVANDYTISVTAEDLSPQNNITVVNPIYTFDVGCENNCVVEHYPDCHDSNNDWNRTNDTMLGLCTESDGCFYGSITNCSDYDDPTATFPGLGWCREGDDGIDDCCVESCTLPYTPVCYDDDNISDCREKPDGCYEVYPNTECGDWQECRIDSDGVANCCDDLDNDGYFDEDCGGDDCDDLDDERNPGFAEICDGKDNDCDLSVDDGSLCSLGWTCDGVNGCVINACIYGNSLLPCIIQ